MADACAELQDFKTATESIDQNIRLATGLERRRFWYDLIPRGTFIKNQGVTRTTLELKPSEPVDDQSKWNDIVLDNTTHQPTPSCLANYEEVAVGFFERTYKPFRRDFRGPVICKRNLTFQTAAEAFLNGYVTNMGQFISRVWELSLRNFYMGFGDIFADYEKYPGPNALATVLNPKMELTQDMLDEVAADMIDVGAGDTDEKGYVSNGNDGPVFPLYIDKVMSAKLLRNDPVRREDAQFANMGHGAEGDLSLWRRIGAQRVIGNFRHITTSYAPRANFVNGQLRVVSPFRSAAAVNGGGDRITAEYRAARYEAAIVAVPTAMTAEVVTPTDWKFPNTQNYNGDWEFVIGGEKICDPGVYDPRGEMGRHFAGIEFAPRPDQPYHAKTIWYRRCNSSRSEIVCDSYGHSY